MGLEHAFRLMVLVVLQLESDFLWVDWTTPSLVSTLEPLLRTLLGSPWCPPNHMSLSFPIWGSCAWFMNLRIHIFSMKMSWFYVVSRASEVWSWLLLIFDWLGWRRKKWQLAEAFPTFCHINFSFMSLEKWWDFNLWRKDSSPSWHVSVFWYD